MANVLIIGAGGRMGNWFYRYLLYRRNQDDDLLQNIQINSKKGKNKMCINKLFLVDSKKLENITEQGVYTSNRITDFVNESNIIIFCTPTEVTMNLISKLFKLFKAGTTIIEVSSIKNQIYEKLEKYSRLRTEIQFLSIHPMFGPGALVSSTNNIILHVLMNSRYKPRETKLVKAIFPNFKIIELDGPANHDKLVSLMISLIYFINLIFSKMLLETVKELDLKSNDTKLKFIKQISGSSYKLQSLLSESILTDDISLFIGLFLSSPISKQIIKKYGRLYNELATKLEKRNRSFLEDYILMTKKEITAQINIESSYESLYKFLNS